MFPARVTTIGADTPVNVRSQQTLLENCPDKATPLQRSIAMRAGVTRRHFAVDPLVEDVTNWTTGARMRRFMDEATPLAKAAVTVALRKADLAPTDVGLLSVVSCTGYATPGLDMHLIRDVGLSPGVERMFVGHMGCFAALPGLAACANYVRAQGRPAVMVNVELTSLHLQPRPWDLEQFVSNSLFGDAVTATVVQPGTPGLGGLDVVDIETRIAPAYADHMTWDVTEHGFRMTLSAQVPVVLRQIVPPAITALLARHGSRVGDVRWWAVHPGGPSILDATVESLGLDPTAVAASRAVLSEYGNCSSATLPLVIDTMQATTPLPPGELGVILGFGPGLTLYSALVRGA